MIAAFIAGALLVTSLLALAARALDELFRLYALPRRWVWAAALLLAVTLPVGLALAPAAPPEAGGAGATDLAAGFLAGEREAAPHASGRVAAWVAAAGVVVDGAVARLVGAAADRVGARTLDRALLGGWLLLTGGAALLLGWTALRLARARREWPPQWLDETRVHVAARGGPAVVGLFRPAIVVPSWLLRAPAERQRLVVLHEREHVSGRDHALLGLAVVTLVLLPWNAPLHWLVRRLRLAVELDCDRRVLRRGADARAYGALLIDMAARAQPLPLGAALADSASDLERRIVALSGAPPRNRRSRAVLAAACAALLLLLATRVDPRAAAAPTSPAAAIAHVATTAESVAAATPHVVPLPAEDEPASAPTAPPPVPAAGTEPVSAPRGGAPGVVIAAPPEETPPARLTVRPLGEDQPAPPPLWVVDGVVVAESEVQARLQPDDIERIEVIKGPAAASLYGGRGAGGVIHITTRQ